MPRPKERTPYGQRLFEARTDAGLGQKELALMVGMSQGTLGEAEWTAHGSSFTTQLAEACKIRPQWLATGKGQKAAESPTRDIPSPVNRGAAEGTSLLETLHRLSEILAAGSDDARDTAALLLPKLARNPGSFRSVAVSIQAALDDGTQPQHDKPVGAPVAPELQAQAEAMSREAEDAAKNNKRSRTATK